MRRRSAASKVKVAIIAVDATGAGHVREAARFLREAGNRRRDHGCRGRDADRAAVLSGEAQFAGIPVGALAILKSRNAPVKAVAGGSVYEPKVPTTVLAAAPGKRISRARDLVGKRLGLDSLNNISHIALQRWLKRGGVSPEDVQIATLPFAQMIAPLLSGQLDAAWLPEPLRPRRSSVERGASPSPSTPFAPRTAS